MTKLFEIKDCMLYPFIENEVYGWFDEDNNEWKYLGRKGEPIDFTPASVKGEEPIQYTGDPTQIECAIEGFYPFSTHPVTYGPDGILGIIGIKDIHGNIIADEQYERVDGFFNGLCAVKMKDSEWGCIDTTGAAVIPFKYYEPLRFNIYGVAVGNDCLVDRNEENLEGTELNFSNIYHPEDRYFIIAKDSDEQIASISKCGTAEGLKVNVYDTLNRRYVAKGVPECRLSINFSEAEPEVLLAAIEMLSEYENVEIWEKGTIFAEKAGQISVFDYYC